MPVPEARSRRVACSGGPFPQLVRALGVTEVCLLALACDGDQPNEPRNEPPVAALTADCVELRCAFTDASSDEDGTIESRAWDFGDGQASALANPTHDYADPGGSFTVTLTVTDDAGAETSVATQVSVSPGPGNAPPDAEFTVACTAVVCRFTDASTDADGTIAAYAWDFGDGQASALANPTHVYDDPGGTFTVTLTVTDNGGAGATEQKSVMVSPWPVPDLDGTYERVTAHSAAGRDSRFVLSPDGTFEFLDWIGTDTTKHTGSWTIFSSAYGQPIPPGTAIGLDFTAIPAGEVCGEGFGAFLMDGTMGVAYCGPAINAGLEEGVYAIDPDPDPAFVPPPQAGQLAFVRDWRIHLVNTDGSGVAPLTDPPAGSRDYGPAWSPDGGRIAFTRYAGGAGRVYLVDADGSGLTLFAAAGQDPTWSPDGQRIAWSCPGTASAELDLCIAEVDNPSASPDTIPRQGWEWEADWSPDGMRIAFTSDYAFFDIWFDVWTIAPDGSGATNLRKHLPGTVHFHEQHGAAWSPDGSRIALAECPWSWSGCTSSALTLMLADGSGLTRIVPGSGPLHPTWSPDGQAIVFSSDNVIEWVSADGTQRGKILANGSAPAWRP